MSRVVLYGHGDVDLKARKFVIPHGKTVVLYGPPATTLAQAVAAWVIKKPSQPLQIGDLRSIEAATFDEIARDYRSAAEDFREQMYWDRAVGIDYPQHRSGGTTLPKMVLSTPLGLEKFSSVTFPDVYRVYNAGTSLEDILNDGQLAHYTEFHWAACTALQGNTDPFVILRPEKSKQIYPPKPPSTSPPRERGIQPVVTLPTTTMPTDDDFARLAQGLPGYVSAVNMKEAWLKKHPEFAQGNSPRIPKIVKTTGGGDATILPSKTPIRRDNNNRNVDNRRPEQRNNSNVDRRSGRGGVHESRYDERNRSLSPPHERDQDRNKRKRDQIPHNANQGPYRCPNRWCEFIWARGDARCPKCKTLAE